VIICFSRCLWCGRRTPHEVCHLHAFHNRLGNFKGGDSLTDEEHARRWDRSSRRAWRRWFSAEPETCDDKSCPLWDAA
jgi:hypothetical protein